MAGCTHEICGMNLHSMHAEELELLGFCTLFIVQHSKKNTTFWKLDVSILR